ncbi:MAG: hypothetical protein FJY65_12010 [Calditrichaeota bacterium]|nr:hypothetical protein [Calditrichota bacterium]
MPRSLTIFLIFSALFIFSACYDADKVSGPPGDDGMPNSPYPANNSIINTDTSGIVRLTWQCSSSSDATLHYDVYFGTAMDSLYIRASYISERYFDAAVERGRTYYWYIVARLG